MKIKILTAGSPERLNSLLEDHIADGWEPIGSHSVAVIHSQNRYSGTQHMDTLHKLEYAITIRMTNNDPRIETGVYWYEDEETGKKVYDEDEMRNEFENKLKNILEYQE